MNIGVALPAQVAGAERADILGFVERIERLRFDSLWVLDRLVYDSLAPLPLLALAAGMTDRVRLGTSILLAMLHSPLLLAKELATIDRLSGGRLTVGVAVGGRGVDFDAAVVDERRRGKRLEETIALLKQAWSGAPIDHDGQVFSIHVPPIGPRPIQSPHPPIWIGGRSQPALERAVRIGAGYIPGRSGPQALAKEVRRLRQAAEAAGRDPGTLSSAGVVFFNMDTDASRGLATIARYLDKYYGPPELLEPSADSVYGSPRDAARRLAEFAASGVDTLILVATERDPLQVDRLAEAVALYREAVAA